MPPPTVMPPKGAPDVLYLIDLPNYVFRAFHALPPLNATTGEPTNATYGMVSMLAKLVEERQPAYLGVALDERGGSFRGELDARYKAHRPPPPPELAVQLARCREIVGAFGIPMFSGGGFEADDYIAAAVGRARTAGLRVVIASADKDLMQLVDAEGGVVLWDAMRDKVYGAAEVQEKFGVPPAQVRDLLALVGDTSDNVPGVKSIGPKKASDLLLEFGTLEGIYAALDQVKKPAVREALRAGEADARLSQALVTLRTDVPMAFDLETLRYGRNVDADHLRKLYTELGFTRFIKTVPSRAASAGRLRLLQTEEELAVFLDAARATGRLTVTVFGSSPEAMRARLVGLALGHGEEDAVYLPLSHFYLGAPPQLPLERLRAVLGPILSDPAVEKVGHDLKYAEVVLRRHGLAIDGAIFDPMLASYLLDPEAANELEALLEREGQPALPTFESIAPKKKGAPARGLDDVAIEDACRYAAPRALAAGRLAEAYRPRLGEQGLADLYRALEMPLSRVLADMEIAGVLVDREALARLGETMSTELAAIEAKAREIGGADLNLASPKQLETLLFDTLGLKSTKKTKTGRSTDAEVLEALADEHPLPKLVLEHRAIAKLKGTYVDSLPRLVHPETGRIHTRWSQAVAATGRLSSQDPNLQNIPIRTELGRMIRRAFVAPPGAAIVSADYSQIELRVLAHLSHDPVLVDSFRKGQDVHVRTAMEVFRVDEAHVTGEMRRRSKTINFGVIYGMGEVALSKRLGIPRAEAADFIRTYFERYRGVHEFMERTMLEARKNESVRTLFGRLRALPDLRSAHPMKRSYAERIAQNTPIQGTAADLLKMAMVRLAAPVVPGARMVLTVHDELAFEVPESAVDEAKEKVRTAMQGVAELDVPLVVDVGAGPTWAEAH